MNVQYNNSASSDNINVAITDVDGDNTPQIADISPITLKKNIPLDNAIDLWDVTTDDETLDENLIFNIDSNSSGMSLIIDKGR
ncbi:MAG: hypothetical protein JSV09_09830 [Thermoplasmata archaeon]|nr:MAG: hypothetical protein JSV09_09830 [Thermoplasmata archaeon]